jgi:hypothetical protein
MRPPATAREASPPQVAGPHMLRSRPMSVRVEGAQSDPQIEMTRSTVVAAPAVESPFLRSPVVTQAAVTPSSAPAAIPVAATPSLRPVARPAPPTRSPPPCPSAAEGPEGFGTLEPGCSTVDEAVSQLRINTASFSAIEYQRVRMKIGRLVKKHVENDAAEERLARATSPVIWAVLHIGDVLRAFPRATAEILREAAPGVDLRVKTAGGFVPLGDDNLVPFGGPGSLHVVTVVGGA